MKQLALRKIATPLKEARRNPKVQQAALFVENLFGRPLRSNPDVILLSEENLAGFLEAVEHDFGATFAFVPFPSLITDDFKRDLQVHPDSEFFGPADMLFHPLGTCRRWYRINDQRVKRNYLLQVAGENLPGKLRGVLRHGSSGAAFKEEGLLVMKASRLPDLLVHELVHFEDYLLIPGSFGRFEWKLTEGRATYAQALFCLIGDEGARGHHYDPRLQSVVYLARDLLRKPEVVLEWVRKFGISRTLADIRGTFQAAGARSSYTYETVYLPFACALADLSTALGDSVSAFRLSTDKLPTNMREMSRPLEFYEEEIRKIRS